MFFNTYLITLILIFTLVEFLYNIIICFLKFTNLTYHFLKRIIFSMSFIFQSIKWAYFFIKYKVIEVS